jgi:hypothetical protein
VDRRAQDRLGITLIVISLISVAALLGVGYSRSSLRDTRDALTSCPIDEPPSGYTALVVDKTDGMSERQLRRLESERDRLLSKVGPGEMVSIYVVDDRTSPVLDPELALCSPGAGRDANPLYQNPGKHEARFQERFAERLAAVVAELERPRSSARSPILEAIHAVASSPEFERSRGRRELVVVSDLLQNVPELSHYSGVPRFEDFRESAYAASVAADLRGAEVRVIYLRRPEDLRAQNDAHRTFWKSVFEESGAAHVEFLQQ